MDRIWNLTAVCLVVAWRTLLACRLGREMPEVSCEAVFKPSEWRSVYNRVVKRKEPPEEPLRLREMVRMVAGLGGFVNRAKGSEPGPETIWKGRQRMRNYADAWDAFGPGSKEAER
ncbi:MAG: IS4 family transposase [Planctomycetia bacterium]